MSDKAPGLGGEVRRLAAMRRERHPQAAIRTPCGIDPAVKSQTLNSSIAAIYETALEPAAWSSTLDRISRGFHSTLQIAAFIPTPYHMRIHAIHNGDPSFMDIYNARFSPLDMGMRALAGRFPEFVAVNRPVRRTQLLADSIYEQTEIYKELFAPFGLFYGAGILLDTSPDFLTGFRFSRGRKHGDFTDSEAAALATLAPHFSQALRLQRRVAELEATNSALVGSLDSLTFGVLLLSEQGRVLVHNRAADKVFAQKDGIVLAASGISSTVPEEDRRLQNMLAAASGSAKTTTKPAGGMITISRPSGQRPLTIALTPVGGESWMLGSERPAALAILTDPESGQLPMLQVVTRLFGLTKREVRLAELLAEGKSTKEAAAECRVSIHTTRSQLKSIFQKTGTTRQGELVSLVLAGAPHPRPQD